MLKIMENETKIFIGWLKKLIKKDKKIKAKELAHIVGCDASTISSYIRGRTKPDFETRKAILEATGTPYATMLEAGRKELSPESPEILKRIEALEQKQTQAPASIEPFINKKNAEHHRTVDKFQDQDTALRINNILVKIEFLDPEYLEKIANCLQNDLDFLEKKNRKDAPEKGTPGERPGKRA